MWDVLSLGTFCTCDVLSLGTFCPLERFVPWDVLSLGPYVLGRFCLGTFSPLGLFVYGMFCLCTKFSTIFLYWTKLFSHRACNSVLSHIYSKFRQTFKTVFDPSLSLSFLRYFAIFFLGGGVGVWAHNVLFVCWWSSISLALIFIIQTYRSRIND